MQIRAANRQDEPIIQNLFSQSLELVGLSLELDGKDSDLRNIEKNYFYYDGLSLVAEDDGIILAFLAACRAEPESEILELRRLLVADATRGCGIARKLLDTAIFFASNMEYKSIKLSCRPGLEKIQENSLEALLKLGFQKEKGSYLIQLSGEG